MLPETPVKSIFRNDPMRNLLPLQLWSTRCAPFHIWAKNVTVQHHYDCQREKDPLPLPPLTLPSESKCQTCLIGGAWVTFLYLMCKEGQKGKYSVFNLLEKAAYTVPLRLIKRRPRKTMKRVQDTVIPE